MQLEFRVLGSNIRLLSERFSYVIPGLKNLIFSEEVKDDVIGLITQFHEEKIIFTNVC